MTKIWNNQVDQKYDVYVEVGNDDYKGVLKIELNGVVLHSQDVTIAYGSPLGPDVADVHKWADICCAFVDEYEVVQRLKQ